MNKQDIRANIEQRIAEGEGKSSIFGALRGQGINDRVLAHLIASHADPKLIAQHPRLIQSMVILAWLQVALGMLASLHLALTVSPFAGLLAAGFIGGFCYLFVWGFRNSRAWAYNASIILSIINLPRALGDLATEPGSSLFALALGVAWIGYTWFVRSKLFPDFAFMGPRKAGGLYQFSS